MGPLDLLNHLLSFLSPALFVGVFVALAGHFLSGKLLPDRALYAKAAIFCVAGGVALFAGLWLFGRDGKMASYAALVLAIGTSQWWTSRRS